MTTPVVLTFVGDDRPGLVNALAEIVAASGATWLDSRSVRLKGKFAGVALVGVPGDRLTGLELSLRQLSHQGLRIALEPAAEAEAEAKAPIVALDILGRERAGIVRDVTGALTRLGVNIEEFTSSLEREPFTGAEMFRARARLSVPSNLKLDDLRRALERLAGEIMVDLAIDESEPDS